MSIDEWTLFVDSMILAVIVVWAVMDRCNIYILNK